MSATHLLSDEQRQILLQDRLVDVSALAITDLRKHRTIKMSVSFSQLALLIDSASVGCRVYELMAIQRPGDLLNYLVVSWVELNPMIEKEIRKGNMDDFTIRYQPEVPLPKLPFPKVDKCFSWRGGDTKDWDKTWCSVRDSGYWRNMISELFPIVQEAQRQLKESQDGLVQRELKMISTFCHPEMFSAEVQRWVSAESLPPGDQVMPACLYKYLCELVARPDTRSVACAFRDYQLWRMLINEQLKRAEAAGIPPGEALVLSCGDMGIPWLPSDFLGADVNVPEMGFSSGDIFVVPGAMRFSVEAANEAGNLSGGIGGRYCRYVVTDRDYGELPYAPRKGFEGWFVYEDETSAAPSKTV
jgi:hypothetical protein